MLVKHWGKESNIEPEIIQEKFGDGKQKIYIQPLNTRPDYYIVSIDSSVNLNDNDQTIDYLDDVLEHIEELFGQGIDFPQLSLDCGYTWGNE